MHNGPCEENVFGAADGSSYSAVLAHAGDGRVSIQSLLIDGHNVPVRQATFGSREQAVAAVEDYARGDRKP
ncbi:hypothetical protein [Acidovorax sp. sic0104]|uniref:hypothetical protein n=1 Tax=Acidovorax sp. sic0104 TaxID=2854784 RepID=UPI001C46750A|nr:hypothetical protein [Acidovorax sp. sic0104]MBV7541189.1 hypothetical protein [Acidovorax sp. sic0104]